MPILTNLDSSEQFSFHDDFWVEMLEECVKLGWKPNCKDWKSKYTKGEFTIPDKECSSLAGFLIEMDTAKIENDNLYPDIDELIISETADMLLKGNVLVKM